MGIRSRLYGMGAAAAEGVAGFGSGASSGGRRWARASARSGVIDVTPGRAAKHIPYARKGPVRMPSTQRALPAGSPLPHPPRVRPMYSQANGAGTGMVHVPTKMTHVPQAAARKGFRFPMGKALGISAGIGAGAGVVSGMRNKSNRPISSGAQQARGINGTRADGSRAW